LGTESPEIHPSETANTIESGDPVIGGLSTNRDGAASSATNTASAPTSSTSGNDATKMGSITNGLALLIFACFCDKVPIWLSVIEIYNFFLIHWQSIGDD
jgi:hypothetical protein